MFTKGQKVHFIKTWNGADVVAIYKMVVYSCGKRQMVLTDLDGNKFKGEHLLPSIEQYNGAVVMAGLTDVEAEKLALDMAADFRTKAIARQRKNVATMTASTSPSWRAKEEAKLAELEASIPNFIYRNN